MEVFKPFTYLRRQQDQEAEGNSYVLNIVMSIPYAYKALVFSDANDPTHIKIRIDQPPIFLHNNNGIEDSNGNPLYGVPMDMMGTQILSWSKEIILPEDSEVTINVLMNHEIYKNMAPAFRSRVQMWNSVRNAMNAIDSMEQALEEINPDFNPQNTRSITAIQNAMSAIKSAEEALDKLEQITANKLSRNNLLASLEKTRLDFDAFLQYYTALETVNASETSEALPSLPPGLDDILAGTQLFRKKFIVYSISTSKVPKKGADSDIIF